MEGEMLDYSIEVSHPAVLAYVYLLATKAQNYVKQSLTNKEHVLVQAFFVLIFASLTTFVLYGTHCLTLTK